MENDFIMEDDYTEISPLYMQRLKGRVEDALWKLFDKSKYKQVEEYMRRWHKSDDFWENFRIYTKDNHIDLDSTLAEMPNDILVKIAADIGVETPGLLPCIPVMKNILNQSNTNAYTNFKRAVRNVYDQPDESVALAASTLEGVFKTIIQNLEPDNSMGNASLTKLTSKVVKKLVNTCDPSTPQEIKTLASQLRALGKAIDDLRSDKSMAHGKGPDDYVVDDALWAETVVNCTATLGIFLWRLFERHQSQWDEQNLTPQVSALNDDIPF